MNQDKVGPLGTETISRSLAAVSRAVIHNPKNAVSKLVGFLVHDLADETIHWGNAGFGFAAAEDFGLMNIPGGKVGPGPLTKILVLYSRGAIRIWGQSGLFAAASLNARLLVCRNDEVIGSQWLALPKALIEIKHDTCFGDKGGIARKYPAPVAPWAQCISTQPAPQSSTADLGDQTLCDHLAPYIGDGEAGKRKSKPMGNSQARALT